MPIVNPWEKCVGVLLSLIGTLLLAADAAHAQYVTATVGVGPTPWAVAVNPTTNKIYVANEGGNSVTVVDGATNQTTNVVLASGPAALAVNAKTNKTYVASAATNTVTVIDGTNYGTTSVPVGQVPIALAVNPVTNKIYVVNNNSGTATVIDGAMLTTQTVTVGSRPVAVAVNLVTNKIYVVNEYSSNVTVIDGATNTTQTVGVGGYPMGVAVNPVTNKIYVANSSTSSNNVTVIDGTSLTTQTVAAGSVPSAVAVNPVTNKIYVANQYGSSVTLIDGSTNSTATLSAGTNPFCVTVNPVTNKIYVANKGSNNVTLIDGTSNTASTLAVGTTPWAVEVNPVTNKIYVSNSGSNNVSVVDGATNLPTSVTTGSAPVAAAVNPVTNKIYVASNYDNDVSVIDGATNLTTTTVAVGTSPLDVAVNPLTNKIYVANAASNNVTVIDGTNNFTTTVGTGNLPSHLAINPVTNMIYALNLQGVTVINGTTNATATVKVGSAPYALAVNPITNEIYVTNCGNACMGTGDGSISVIQGATNTTTTIVDPIPWPSALALNPVTNKIYVVHDSPVITVIDGATKSTSTVNVGSGPVGIAVNPVTNKIYVANHNDNTVTVVDGATNSTTVIADPNIYPEYVVANPVTNKIYVTHYYDNIMLIDGATNTTRSISTVRYVYAPALNPVTGTLYVPNGAGTSSVTVITEQAVQQIPLLTIISPLAGNQTVNPTPTFTFNATSYFGPYTPTPLAMWYQVDTWQGRWLAATGTSPTFTGKTPNLLPGTHILYAFATDGQDANSTGVAQKLVGRMAAYQFQILPTVTLSATFLSFGNQAKATTSAARSVRLTNAGTSALTINSISVIGTDASDFAQTNNCGSSVVAKGQCTISVKFTPPDIGSSTAMLYISDSANTSPQAVLLTGTGVPQVAWSPSWLNFGTQPVATKSPVKKVNLTNNLSTVLTITGITFAGANGGDFAQTNTCGSSVAAKAKCVISVTFTPSADGVRTAIMNINDNANSSPQSVALMGTGEDQVVWSPDWLTFDPIPVGTASVPQVVTLTNNLSIALTITNIYFDGANPGDFAQTNTCGSTVAAKGKCTITVTFTPQAIGTRIAALEIADSANNSPQAVLALGSGQ